MASFPIGNIMAPPFMAVSPSIAGYDDLECDLSLPAPTAGITNASIAVPASTIQLATPTNNQQLQLDSDYDYLVREIQFVQLPVTDEAWQPSDLRVRIRDAFGRLVTSDFVQCQNLCGQLPIMWALKKGGVLSFDFQNVNADYTINVVVVLKGWKRIPCPGKPATVSDYVPLWKRYALPVDKHTKLEDFEYYFSFTQTGAADLLRVPLQTDNDADFLWRGNQGDWNCANNDVATVGSVGVCFYDPGGSRIRGDRATSGSSANRCSHPAAGSTRRGSPRFMF